MLIHCSQIKLFFCYVFLISAIGVVGTVLADDHHSKASDSILKLREEFDGKTELNWSVRAADTTQASLAKKPGFLTITTQYGDIIDTRNSAKNIYLTNIPSDVKEFQITTCIDKFQPQSNWNQAGILCFSDMDNYVKFTIENNPNGGRRLVMIGEFRGRPIIKGSPDKFPQSEKLWLRILKRGDQYQFYVSSDGIHFVLCENQSWARSDRLASPKWFGLMAINGPDHSAPNVDASFDFIELHQLEKDKYGPLLEQTLSHLELYPRDAYAQYVALHLARVSGQFHDVSHRILANNTQRIPRNRRLNQVNLFSIFSGQLAIQESLQLDALSPEEPLQEPTLRNRRTGPRPVERRERSRVVATDSVPISTLEGPSIQSHPWKEMLDGRSPQVTGLALLVPEDFYFVSFQSVNKLFYFVDLATNWGMHVFSQSNRDASTQLVGERLMQQLALGNNTIPFYDDVISEVAITGSDLFLREGSDVTLLFELNQPVMFRNQMEQFLSTAENSRQDARRSTGNYLDVDYTHVSTPDRQVYVFSAYPTPDVHVRSNSLVGLKRVLEAILGKNSVQALGATEEFRYIRTLFSEGNEKEDGIVYFSDPFVRRMMSAELRLTERRRMVCYNHLRMIGHAALLHQQLEGTEARSLEELDEANCTPGIFGKGKFECPDHGKYDLSADGITGVCSKHGYASYMTPCSEIPITHVSNSEATAYRQFVMEYSRFWQQFFDPIVVRLQVSEEKLRAETIVLPLINNTAYANLVRSIGGEPEALDGLPVPKRNIFTFAVRLNKRGILQQLGMESLLEQQDQSEEPRALELTARTLDVLRRFSLAMLNYHDSQSNFPQAELIGKDDQPLLSWRVKLLPYLGEQALYDEFRFDEPWDSSHNSKLIKRMPTVYRPSNSELANAGKTRFVAPRGEGTVFTTDNRKISLRQIRDGSSNTILLLEADDDHAVIWTKPDDLKIDMNRPDRGLFVRPAGNFIVAMCDGSVWQINERIPQPELAAMFTRAGGEVTNWNQFAIRPQPRRRGGFLRLPETVVHELNLQELLVKGVGNQVGFHVYDSDPMIDINLARFMGLSFSSFGRRGFADEFLFVMPLLGAINGPVYLSIPIEDKKVVDDFLERLDSYLARKARRVPRGRFFSIDQDFYHLTDDSRNPIRTYCIEFGPFKWRFFWARIDNAVYIASKREVLDDLMRLGVDAPTHTTSGNDVAQALIRLRPQNWNQVISAYQLGWEENRREACLKNLGPLTSLSRVLSNPDTNNSSPTKSLLDKYAARVYDVHHFCPDGGLYELSSVDSSCKCSIHGSALHPEQNLQPSTLNDSAWQLDQFQDLNIRFSFLEDGLRAIATLERESKSSKQAKE